MGVMSAFLPGTLKAYATPEKVVPKSTAMTRRSSDDLVVGDDMVGELYCRRRKVSSRDAKRSL